MNSLIDKLGRRDTLSPEEKTALEHVLGAAQSIPAGVDIVREGDRPDHSTLLTRGITARYTTVAVRSQNSTSAATSSICTASS